MEKYGHIHKIKQHSSIIANLIVCRLNDQFEVIQIILNWLQQGNNHVKLLLSWVALQQ